MLYYEFQPKNENGKKISVSRESSPSPDRFKRDMNTLTITNGRLSATVVEYEYEHNDVDGVYSAMGVLSSADYSVTLELDKASAEGLFVYHIAPDFCGRLGDGSHELKWGAVTLLSTQRFDASDEEIRKSLLNILWLYKNKISPKSDAMLREKLIKGLFYALLSADENEAHLLVFQRTALHSKEAGDIDARAQGVYETVFAASSPASRVELALGTTILEKGMLPKDVSEVVLPPSLKQIGEEAFGDCKNLRGITLPQGLETIGAWAFLWCEALERIVIPGSVKTVPYQCFLWCGCLKEAILEEGVEEIAPRAFESCKGLECITVPASVTKIASNLLGYRSELKQIRYGGTKSMWQSVKPDIRILKVSCTDGDIE